MNKYAVIFLTYIASKRGIKGYPLYTKEEVERAIEEFYKEQTCLEQICYE